MRKRTFCILSLTAATAGFIGCSPETEEPSASSEPTGTAAHADSEPSYAGLNHFRLEGAMRTVGTIGGKFAAAYSGASTVIEVAAAIGKFMGVIEDPDLVAEVRGIRQRIDELGRAITWQQSQQERENAL
ncbi:MAG TPA: hypothetical protein VK524_29315, partial [Polyangiaceae bacterium]|nr:hypothetical protein [Polyangiaceae bacterium]